MEIKCMRATYVRMCGVRTRYKISNEEMRRRCGSEVDIGEKWTEMR
jgi:hypothetical protein